MKLSKYFDKVYVINLITRPDRRQRMTERFIRLGLFDDLLDGTIEFVDAVRLPCFDEQMVEAFTTHGKADFYSTATHTFNVGLCMCSFEHYRVISRAKAKGYKRILVLEDDACFFNDVSALEKALDNMPEDFNILHLEGYYCPETEDEETYIANSILNETIEDASWKASEQLRMFGAAALVYSENGMNLYLENQNGYMRFSDCYTFVMTDKCYFYSYPLVMQEDEMYSDIVESINCIANYNIYLRHANKENYI